MREYSDEQIVRMFGEEKLRQELFTSLVRRYKERLYWHIRKIVIIHEDADDVLQNCFEKVWKNLTGFRGESQLSTWLYRIATNEAMSLLQQRRNKSTVPFEDYMADQLLDCDCWSGDEIETHLEKAVLNLPEKQRIVFNMKYYDEMKYEEMSEILNTSVGALKASYHHAVSKIKDYFEQVSI